MARTEEILQYWFGEPGDGWSCGEDRLGLWFGKNEAVDAELRRRFGEDVTRALAGEYDQWAESARGRLALVVLLDQLTRNIFRGTADAYLGDQKARALVHDGLQRQLHRRLLPIERAFFYLPLEHSESIEDQRFAVMLFDELERESPPSRREPFARFRDYALRHEAIIERFGRFPHRNAALGRTSSPEEAEFLLGPGSSF